MCSSRRENIVCLDGIFFVHFYRECGLIFVVCLIDVVQIIFSEGIFVLLDLFDSFVEPSNFSCQFETSCTDCCDTRTNGSDTFETYSSDSGSSFSSEFSSIGDTFLSELGCRRYTLCGDFGSLGSNLCGCGDTCAVETWVVSERRCEYERQ